jgi:hypothetical protein
MPEGTITGVQFTKAPNYVQVVGYMDQTKINMVQGDAGGEMDPHGADLVRQYIEVHVDLRADIFPSASVVTPWAVFFSPTPGLEHTFRPSNGTSTHLLLHSLCFISLTPTPSFMGGNIFCLKACDPSKSDDEKYCQHIYDTQGCGFNAPSNAKDGVFESCASDNQPIPGQGPAIPPQSSQCSTYASTDIYGPSATVRVPIPGASTMSFSSVSRPTPTSSSTQAADKPTTSTSSSGTSAPQETAGNSAAGITVSLSFAIGVLALIAGAQVLM